MDEERDILHAVSVAGIVVKITSWNNPFVWNCEIDCFINCFKGYALSILYCIHHLLTLFTASLPCSIQKCCLMCHNTKSVPIRSNFFLWQAVKIFVVRGWFYELVLLDFNIILLVLLFRVIFEWYSVWISTYW